jgi:hypothetical protein
MRKLTAIAITAALATGAAGCFAKAIAADLGKPATVEQIAKMPPPSPFQGCFVEASVAGTFLAAGDRVGAGAVGMGCLAKIPGTIIIGGGIRQEIGNSVNSGEIFGRFGFKLNDHVDLYVPLIWKAPNWSVANTGSLNVGLGVETNAFSDNITLFAEGATAVAQIGSATKDDITTRVGIRFWLK